MADTLINLLRRKECTVQEVKSYLESQPNIPDVINKENEWGCPLLVAVETDKEFDILKELIKQGANVNQKWQGYRRVLDGVWRFKVVESRETHCYETIKLLLESGADVNDVHNCSESSFMCFLKSGNILRSKIFIPILQLMLQYVNNITKDCAIFSIIIYLITERNNLMNYIQPAKMILHSGALLRDSAIQFLFELALKKISRLNSKKKVQNIIRLFKIFLPYYMLRSTRSELRKTTNQIKTDYTSIRTKSEEGNSNRNVHITEKLDLLVCVWNSCMEEWTNMQSDIITNNSSILQVLRNSCVESNATSEEAYGVLLRYDLDMYPHFKDIMSDTVKNSNMMELYVLISRERFGNVYFIHPDSFYVIKEYLAKEDLFNFLLTLLTLKN